MMLQAAKDNAVISAKKSPQSPPPETLSAKITPTPKPTAAAAAHVGREMRSLRKIHAPTAAKIGATARITKVLATCVFLMDRGKQKYPAPPKDRNARAAASESRAANEGNKQSTRQ